MAKKLIFIDLPGFKTIPNATALKVSNQPQNAICVTDESSAKQVLASVTDATCLIINAPKLNLLEQFRQQHPHGTSILVTDQPMDQYSTALAGREFEMVEHIIANRAAEEWTTNELRVTLQKILHKDIFGLEKYLRPNSEVIEHKVTGTAAREQLNTEVARFAEKHKLGPTIAKLGYGICEELLMNAIFDAPHAAGRTEYSNVRTDPVVLKDADCSYLRYAFDGSMLALSVRDPFGAFAKEKFFGYLKKVLVRNDSDKLIDSKKEGAGLGLYKILYSSHALICNSNPKKATEIIALIDTSHSVRDFSKTAKSIHFFSVTGQ